MKIFSNIFPIEWTDPTLDIIRTITIIFSIILLSPHFPGAGTFYFAGVSAFIVLAFTWSASNIIGDVIAGLVIIYGRSIRIKDWIKVGDIIGEVQEQNLLFHKISTTKNCIITVPNNTILKSFSNNLSSALRDHWFNPLILCINVGIGYDVPREKVEKTLLNAANKTLADLVDNTIIVKKIEKDIIDEDISQFQQTPSTKSYDSLH